MKKVVLFSVLALSVGSAFADTIGDITNTINYLPGGKYRVYGPGRGDVAKLTGSVHRFGAPNIQRMGGGLEIERQPYQGVIHYEQQFDNHGWRQHSPFHSQQIVTVPVKGAGITANGTNVSNFTIIAKEIHPDDGYDGEQGGGYPAPKGARDIYNYQVKGTVKTTRLTNLDVPYVPITPENNPFKNDNADNGNNRQPENNSGDKDRSHDNHDLAGSDNPNMPDNSASNDTNPYWNELKLADDLAKDTSVTGRAGVGIGTSQTYTYKGEGRVETAISRDIGIELDASAEKRIGGFNDDDLSGRSIQGCVGGGWAGHLSGCGGYNITNGKIYGTGFAGTGTGFHVIVSDVYRETNGPSSNNHQYDLPNYDHNIGGTFGWQ